MGRDVRGRVVLVTGASRGIGRRVATKLAKLGAILAVTARSENELATLVNELRTAGTEVEAFAGDLTNPNDRERIVASTIARFGKLDVLVNSAGVCSFGEFRTSGEEITRKLMEVNFFATAEMMRLCTPHLTRSADTATNGWVPAIVNVASVCGRWGIPSLSEHCASKHAIVGLSESLRPEFARFGIEVLMTLPGLVQTDDVRKHLLRNEPKIYLDTANAQPTDEVADGVVQTLLKSRKEKPVGFLAWWVCFGKRMFPRFVRFIMMRKVRNYAKREQRQAETSNR